MKGLFIPDITAEMFRNGCLEGIEALMAEGEIYDIYYEPERLTDDDFETIRIHLNACKEELCNQRRWNEAREYERIIDRFMAFASAQPEVLACGNGELDAQPEQRKGEWVVTIEDHTYIVRCSKCGCKPLLNRYNHDTEKSRFCPHCGADMRGEQDD